MFISGNFLAIDLGETWSCLSVFSWEEHSHGAEARSAAHDRNPHGCWCILPRLRGGLGLEVRKSLRGDTKVQGREVCLWENKDRQGELVATSGMDLLFLWHNHLYQIDPPHSLSLYIFVNSVPANHSFLLSLLLVKVVYWLLLVSLWIMHICQYWSCNHECTLNNRQNYLRELYF